MPAPLGPRQPSIPTLGPEIGFPDVRHALVDPPGLLAIGGDVSPERVLSAYRSGIFPWYEAPGPVLWWSPDPRFVWLPGSLQLPKRLARTLRQRGGRTTLTIDRNFKHVLLRCGPERAGATGTWITEAMVRCYLDLYDRGHAHSIEMSYDSVFCAGILGLSIGGVFFAESMFSTIRDGSKILLWALLYNLFRAGFSLVDCQVGSSHVCALGAHGITRERYLALLAVGLASDRGHFWQQPSLSWPETEIR